MERHKRYIPTLNKPIVLGFGTGRCGTHSLQRILDRQEGYAITHEGLMLKFLPLTKSFPLVIKYFNAAVGDIAGDVGWYWLNYMDRMIQMYDAKAVYIERPVEEVVESFWSIKKNAEDYVIITGDETPWWNYPFFGTRATKDQLAETMIMYQKSAKLLLKEFPQIWHMPIDDLNDPDKIQDMLIHIGIPAARTDPRPVHSNKRVTVKKGTTNWKHLQSKALKWMNDEDMREGLGVYEMPEYIEELAQDET